MRANPDYVLGPGDKIKLTVFGETDLSGDFTLDGSGNLALPLVGQVRAAGYTAPQLEATIGSAMSQGYLKSPRISVEVATYRPFYIIGAVNRPGEYPYVNHMNALNAIALAGGYTNTAVESVVYVRREGSNTEIRMPTDRSTQIYPGDVIRVHNTFFSDAMSLLSPLSGPAGIVAATAITTPLIWRKGACLRRTGPGLKGRHEPRIPRRYPGQCAKSATPRSSPSSPVPASWKAAAMPSTWRAR